MIPFDVAMSGSTMRAVDRQESWMPSDIPQPSPAQGNLRREDKK
jgi:hypothetical protein